VVEEPTPAPPLPTGQTRAVFSDIQLRALSVWLERQTFMRMAGMQYDGRRDLYAIFGYDRVVTSQQYRDEYARGGIAKRIVDAYPKATWRGGVELYEDEDPEVETPFEKAWESLEKRLGVWNELQNADILAGQSTYSAILIGAKGAPLEEELPRGKGPDDLLYLQPFFGGGGPGNQASSPSSRMQASAEDVTIEEFDLDPESPRFGEPKSYRIRRTDIASPMLARPVHWSRVIHVCEGALDNNVYGVPTLEAVWNLLFDLEKITGGGSESAFQRAKHSLHADIDKDMTFGDDQLAELKKNLEEYQHGVTNLIPTQGVGVSLLESKVADFGGNADAIMKQIAGTTAIPMRILTGSEMGSLASEQDATNFDNQVQDRRTGYAGPKIVRKLVDRLVAYGYLPAPEKYEVGWPEEEETENEKADYAVKLATVNKTQGEVVVTNDEIREMAFGREPLTDDEKKPVGSAQAPGQDGAQGAQGGPGGAKGEPAAGKPGPRAVAQPRAAQDADWVRVLEAAIRAGDRETIDRVLGTAHKYGTAQVQLPPSVADRLLGFGLSIDDADVDEGAGGRETDAHVTVKYGILAPDAEALGDVQVQLNGRLTALKKAGSLGMTLGKSAVFQGEDYDVVYVAVKGEDLAAVNRAIAAKLPCAPSDHPAYQPHATVAYVKAGTGAKYAGWDGLNGYSVYAERVTLVDADGNRTEVPLA